jgi:aminopeptidase N
MNVSLRTSVLLLIVISSCQLFAQPFTRADTLRGMLTAERRCYDVTFYDLDVRIDPATKTINGQNTITFRAVENFQRMQVDLHHLLEVKQIYRPDNEQLAFQREGDAIFISFPRPVPAGTVAAITIEYGGTPLVAEYPPWKGGLIWAKSPAGEDWVAVACQGIGASVWWPNKDHQSDEPDSMMIRITAPPGLENISNGRLRSKTTLPDGWTRYDWFVANPINNYCVTFNIGKFEHFSEQYTSNIDGQSLTLDYYVLPENLSKAREQFRQVRDMLDAFEHHFGKYPFYNDGFKMIESPHLGMEHQSAIAYGNHYFNGYLGTSNSAVGLKFDFIIIHEAAHEWWGNHVTANDVADLWIHESFGAYAEAVYVEYHWGYEEALKYINGKKPFVRYDRPIQGTYNVNREGSGDMYNKGQLVLNTLRHVINRDTLWWEILRGLQKRFGMKSIDAVDVWDFIGQQSGMALKPFFEQYFQHVDIPTLEVMLTKQPGRHVMRYRWKSDVENFEMPVKVTTAPGHFTMIYPTTTAQTMEISNALVPEEFRVATDQFYVNPQIRWQYMVEDAPQQPPHRRQ